MNRRYTVEEFDSYVRELRSKVHGISLETDLLVGYPTETAEDFRESVSLDKEGEADDGKRLEIRSEAAREGLGTRAAAE